MITLIFIIGSVYITGITTNEEVEAIPIIEAEGNKQCKSVFADMDVLFYIYDRKRNNYTVATSTMTGKTGGAALRRILVRSWWTKIYVHGWLQNYKTATIVVEKYIKEDLNIVVVDWSRYSGCGYMYVVYNMINNVAQVLCNFIYSMVNVGLSSDKIHIIGHSFGAHIAGLASACLQNNKVFRITGLDPSKIPFDMYSPKFRLDKSSAKFVDVIRTSFFGSNLDLGHVNFYPNRGHNQPGCKGIFRSVCDHSKSVTYYAESIVTKTGFFATKCFSNFQNFDNGTVRKTEHVILMGELVPINARGQYCLTTNKAYPYARGIKSEVN